MKHKMEIAPSLMCMDFLKMQEQFEILNQNVDMYHIDIMDGHYCKNITLSPDLVKTFSKVVAKPMDVHLMTTNPIDWIDLAAKAGATYISPHAETINVNAFRVINMIKDAGCKVGIVLNPATPLSQVELYLNKVDMLTIMTVDVGFAGQSFIDEMSDKISDAKKLRETKGYHYKIQIDGACNKSTYKKLYDAGADVLVLGSSGLFGLDENLSKACQKMYQEIDEALA